MWLTLAAAALSAVQLASLPVPYVPQTDALCGGAAVAMVFRYWGDSHAGAAQFGALVERHAGGTAGIAADVLTTAVATRGWLTAGTDPSVDALRARLAARQPVVVLIADGRAGRTPTNRYHYVVVVGITPDAVVVHDPSWGPFRALKYAAFETVWSAANHWSLVILPSAARAHSGAVTADTRTPRDSLDASASECDVLLHNAIAAAASRDLEQAEELLTPVREQCPDEPGAYRELAGVRFAQKRFAEATVLAREALARDAEDPYASDVLGSSLFMLDDPAGALQAWNRAGKPQLDGVTVDGVHHTRQQSIVEALRLTPNTLLTADAFAQAQHRLAELPDRSLSRLSIRPQPDGFASVDVAIAERATLPRGSAAWTGIAVRAAVDRETSIALPGLAGQGELWTATWRWYQNRPRAAVSYAAPGFAGLPGIWRVDASWERETYAAKSSTLQEIHQHAGLSVSDWITGHVRAAATAGADMWDGGRRAASLGGSLERRWRSDRLSVFGEGTTWVPIDGGHAFSRVGVRANARSASIGDGWVYTGATGANRVTSATPLGLWPGAGEGRAREALLRAHPLLDAGVIALDGSAFGRTIQYASAEAQHPIAWLGTGPLAIATFVDAARASRRADGTAVGLVDMGAGFRIRVPGLGQSLRIDFAHGLVDGANALTVGLAY